MEGRVKEKRRKEWEEKKGKEKGKRERKTERKERWRSDNANTSSIYHLLQLNKHSVEPLFSAILCSLSIQKI